MTHPGTEVGDNEKGGASKRSASGQLAVKVGI
jgi:hypothetical protein